MSMNKEELLVLAIRHKIETLVRACLDAGVRDDGAEIYTTDDEYANRLVSMCVQSGMTALDTINWMSEGEFRNYKTFKDCLSRPTKDSKAVREAVRNNDHEFLKILLEAGMSDENAVIIAEGECLRVLKEFGY